MFTAKLSNGTTLSLVEYMDKKQLLHNLRLKETFYCRSCCERVILKLGDKRIPHFAHVSGAICTEYHEPESYEHLEGKMKLFLWLKEKGLEPIMECYYPSIKQRADISFHFGEQTYCIEYQCSTIGADIFRKRTKGYQKIAAVPIWVLGGEKLKRKGSSKVSLSQFQYLFLRTNSLHQSYLLSYCPHRNVMITLQNIIPLTIRTAYVQFSIKPLQKVELKEFLDPIFSPSLNWREWRIDLNRYKDNLLFNKTSKNEPILLELYTQSIHPKFMPYTVGLPLLSNFGIVTAPFIWQSYIFLEHFYLKPLHTEVYFHNIYITILKRITRKEIIVRDLPCVSRHTIPFAIAEYLSTLTRMGILLRKKNNVFLINKEMKIAKNMEEWLMDEASFHKIVNGIEL